MGVGFLTSTIGAPVETTVAVGLAYGGALGALTKPAHPKSWMTGLVMGSTGTAAAIGTATDSLFAKQSIGREVGLSDVIGTLAAGGATASVVGAAFHLFPVLTAPILLTVGAGYLVNQYKKEAAKEVTNTP